MIHAGAYERLVDDSIEFAKKAISFGVNVTLKVWPCQQHVFQCFYNFIPEASEALDEAASWISDKNARIATKLMMNLEEAPASATTPQTPSTTSPITANVNYQDMELQDDKDDDEQEVDQGPLYYSEEEAETGDSLLNSVEIYDDDLASSV
jgi:hypothetical protein